MRFGIVGTGHWARTVHLPGLAQTPGVLLVALWGRDASQARLLADRHGLRAYAKFDDMLAHVDALSFAVPPLVQSELALRAATAGKHLLLEKPVATTSVAARAILAKARASGVHSIVFFTRRFVPEIEAAIEAASLQTWTQANATVHASVMANASPYFDSRWRQKLGAVLWDSGPHALSILIPVLGPVRAIGASEIRGNTVTFSTIHARNVPAHVSLTLHGDPAGDMTRYGFGREGRTFDLPDPAYDRPQVLARAAQELVEQASGAPARHRCDLAFGTGIVEVLEEIERRQMVVPAPEHREHLL